MFGKFFTEQNINCTFIFSENTAYYSGVKYEAMFLFK